jgi:hypothetical protein
VGTEGAIGTNGAGGTEGAMEKRRRMTQWKWQR